MNERKILNSWKEISRYLGRGVRTIQRYEAEFGLPVRRPKGQSRASVMAFSDEINRWLEETLTQREKSSSASNGSAPDTSSRPHANGSRIGMPHHRTGAGGFVSPSNLELLNSVVITPELWRRPAHETDPERLNTGLRRLTAHLQGSELGLLNALVRAGLKLCDAHTAGFSTLCKNQKGEEFFRWDALAGALENAVGGTTPRDWSPCGLALNRQSPQLVSYPGRCFESLRDAQPPIVEGLVLPVFLESGQPLGTVWIVSHDKLRKFDCEDVRVMNSLAHFTAAAIRLARIRSRFASERSANDARQLQPKQGDHLGSSSRAS
jgi:hypothetical protein